MQPIIRNQWQGIAKVANDGKIESKVRLEIAPNVSVVATVSTAGTDFPRRESDLKSLVSD